MSKFLDRINEYIKPSTPEDKAADAKQRRKDEIEKDVAAGDKDPQKRRIAKKIKTKRDELEKALDKELDLEANGVEFTPRTGPETGGEFQPASKDDFAQEPEEEPTPDPMTTEGETFYVNLARKALFVDLDNASLTDAEREAVTQDVQPENAKEVARILRKVVVDYGLGESFDSRIDALIEDLKKNDRVVVLVPGSFKPPHKGH